MITVTKAGKAIFAINLSEISFIDFSDNELLIVTKEKQRFSFTDLEDSDIQHVFGQLKS